MRSSSRKLAAALVGLCVLGFVLYRSSKSFHLGEFSGTKLLHAIGQANLYLLVLSIVAIYGCYALRAVRWQVFQKNLGLSSFWNIYKMTLAGFSALQLLGRLGEPVRPLLLARKEKLPVSGEFGIYVLERIFDFASMAIIAGIALVLLRTQATASPETQTLETAAKTAGSALILAVVAAAGFLAYFRVHGFALLERRLEKSLKKQGWRGSAARAILGLAHGVQTIRSWSDLALGVLYSAAHWFLVLLIYLWVSHSFGGVLGNLNLRDAMLLMSLTLVGSLVQLPGVGGGSQAVSALVYTTIFGVEKEPAAAAAIVLWLITFAACSLAGVPLLIREGWSLGELKRMAEQEKETEAGALQSAPARGDRAE
jgi:uncharacterized protein (TIRG00374 family)